MAQWFWRNGEPRLIEVILYWLIGCLKIWWLTYFLYGDLMVIRMVIGWSLVAHRLKVWWFTDCMTSYRLKNWWLIGEGMMAHWLKQWWLILLKVKRLTDWRNGGSFGWRYARAHWLKEWWLILLKVWWLTDWRYDGSLSDWLKVWRLTDWRLGGS
jgi:hypothetical protein